MGRAGEIKRPDLPPGRARDLNAALHELHRQAGLPSAREIARETGMVHSTVHNVFARARLPQYEQFMRVVGDLAIRVVTRSPVNDPQELVLDATCERFHELWHRAKTAEGYQGWKAPGGARQIVLRLNTRNPLVLRDMGDAAHLQRTVRSLCPGAVTDWPPRSGRLLYRLDTGSNDPILQIQTPNATPIGALPVDYAVAMVVEHIEWLATGSQGRKVQFRLDANATRAIRRTEGRGKRVPLTISETIAWWERQASRCGLTTVSCRSQPLRTVIARRGTNNPIILRATRLDGTALVTDPVDLQRAILSGVGRGRAYGLGLLSVAPAEGALPEMAPITAVT